MIQGPGYALTFLYYFSGTVLLVGLVGIQGLGYTFEDRALYQVAVPFALLTGSIGAYLNQSILLTIPLKPKHRFQQQLQSALQEMGYSELGKAGEISGEISSDNTTVYARAGLQRILSGKIFVQIEPTQATISGRSSLINRLEKRLMPQSNASKQ